jgi:hypothetical protein
MQFDFGVVLEFAEVHHLNIHSTSEIAFSKNGRKLMSTSFIVGLRLRMSMTGQGFSSEIRWTSTLQRHQFHYIDDNELETPLYVLIISFGTTVDLEDKKLDKNLIGSPAAFRPLCDCIDPQILHTVIGQRYGGRFKLSPHVDQRPATRTSLSIFKLPSAQPDSSALHPQLPSTHSQHLPYHPNRNYVVSNRFGCAIVRGVCRRSSQFNRRRSIHARKTW